MKNESISYEEFEWVDFRSGTIIKAEPFSKAKKPAFKIWVDFGPELGILQSSAQVTVHYTVDSLIGRQVVGCINLGEKNIAGFVTQFLVVGFSDEKGNIALVSPDYTVANGMKLH